MDLRKLIKDDQLYNDVQNKINENEDSDTFEIVIEELRNRITQKQSKIEFENGSKIECIPSNNSVRGKVRRYDENY